MKKILSFEDEPLMGKMYGAKFEQEGYDYKNYISPPPKSEDLINLVIKEKPDLILMSVIMPVMDGYTATKILKNDERTKNIPIFFLTSLGKEEDVKRGISLGARDYFVKANLMPSQIINFVKEFFDSPENYKPKYNEIIKNKNK